MRVIYHEHLIKKGKGWKVELQVTAMDESDAVRSQIFGSVCTSRMKWTAYEF